MNTLETVMIKMKLNRAMAQLRHLNEEMFVVINDLWRTIGRDNIFTFKFTLTYMLSYLEEYLELSEKRYMMLERNDFKLGENENIKVNMFEAALDGFIKLEDDPSFPKVTTKGEDDSLKLFEEENSKFVKDWRGINRGLTALDQQTTERSDMFYKSDDEIDELLKERFSKQSSIRGSKTKSNNRTFDKGEITQRDNIRADVYIIKVNNPLFYNKLGKYPQVMEMFRLIGFTKKTRQLGSALKNMRDVATPLDMALSWHNHPSNEVEREISRLSVSRYL